CLALQTCCNVDRVPENRIVEAQVRSDIADYASTCVDTYADAKRQKWLASTGFLLTLEIERLKAVDHVKPCRARLELMVRNIKRRVPEAHDGIADVLVDGSFVPNNRVRKRGKQPIHQRREALRVILVRLGN